MTKFQISKRQALIVFIICTISSKLQLLPCLLAGEAKNDLWLILLFGGLIDLIFLLLTISINKLCPGETIHDIIRKSLGKSVSFIIGVALFLYLILTATLPYEAIRDVFASNLFDSLAWQIFSIFLLICVGYLAYSGIKTIGRTAELYFPIIAVSVMFLIILGTIYTDFSQILPIVTNKLDKLFDVYSNHTLWFGDYMIFFVLIGRIKPDNKPLKYKDSLVYVLCILIYTVAYVAFYGLYTITAGSQSSLLSSISAFSLLSLDIGRVDWFLVLLSQIASIISCATYISCASDCIYQLTHKKNYTICVIFASLLLYFADLLFFKNIDQGILFYTKYTGLACLIIQISIPIICLVCAFVIKRKNRRKLC